jgi:hypothetical protein
MEVSGQHHAPAALRRGKSPGTHWVGGWVGPNENVIKCSENPSFMLDLRVHEIGTQCVSVQVDSFPTNRNSFHVKKAYVGGGGGRGSTPVEYTYFRKAFLANSASPWHWRSYLLQTQTNVQGAAQK